MRFYYETWSNTNAIQKSKSFIPFSTFALSTDHFAPVAFNSANIHQITTTHRHIHKISSNDCGIAEAVVSVRFFFHTDLIQFNHYDLLSWLARKRSNPLSSDAQNTMLNNEHLTVKIAGGDAMNFRMTNITSVPNALWISNKSEDRERCSTIIPILSYWNENEWDYYNN